MPAKTDFNVSPYWDTFNVDNDFYRVLFRPGFAVQARELTTLPTILQNQIEQFGNHFFKEGTIVIPGSVAYDNKYYAVKIQATYGASTVADFLDQYNGSIITGATSGVTAEVIGYAVADSATGDPDTLFVKYVGSSTVDNSTMVFTDDETLSADKIINSEAAGTATSQLQATLATATGTAASVTAGIFYVRGFMTRTTSQTITLDKYTNTPSYRIGFTVAELLITPEEDSALLDNAAGASNYAAKGAHRFKMTLTLAKKTLTATDDSNFIELARVENGVVVHRKEVTEYSVVSEMLARRTDDESGDYVVNHFDIEPRESLATATNRGVYTAAQGGDATKAVLVASPGKAYVNGHEVETQNTRFVTIDKPRTTKNLTGETVPAALGQYAKVDNVYNQPDITLSTTILDPFDIVKLYNTPTVTRGSSSGTNIGFARSRAFEYKSGTVAATTAEYHHYLFDISMFTLLTMSGNVTTLAANSVVTGSLSGATGIVTAAASGSATVYVMQTEGAFQINDVLASSDSGDNTAARTVTAITAYDFGTHVKQIFMDSTIDYSADTILDQSFILTGEVTYASSTTVTGTSTKFLTELIIGDIIELPTGAGGATEERRVTAIASNLSLTVASAPSNAVTSVKSTRIRAKIAEEEEVVLIYKTPKENTKTLKDSADADTVDYTFRKQYTATTDSSSIASFSADSGETFNSASAGKDYTLSVRVSGGAGGNLAAGALLDISSTKAGTTSISGEGGQTLTVTDATLLGTNAQVTLMATVSISNKAPKTKNAQKMQSKTIASNASTGTYSDIFGERVGDKIISLSYADVYKVHAIYESDAIGNAPVASTLTVASVTGTFTIGEVITGDKTGATGRVISYSNPTVTYVKLTGTLTTQDAITGGTSGAIASTISATTAGSSNVTSKFLLDDGQRDSFYDLGRIYRKGDALTPTGQLLIIYDYFLHQTTNDYFSVDSYAGQIDYADIPEYRATKVDPESKAPKGVYELRDSLDWRPRVQPQTAPAACPFSFSTKNFEAAGSSQCNLVMPDDNITLDFDFYLPRLDLLYLDQFGRFITKSGIPAEAPVYPSVEYINMLVAKVSSGAYVYNTEKDITIEYRYNRRYTMKDIGNLEKRIGHLEYATSLGLLERETDSFQVLDSDGLDRFKSGFIVDNFYGHNIGNTLSEDYQVAVDPSLGHLRPNTRLNEVSLIEENTSTAQRTTSGYALT